MSKIAWPALIRAGCLQLGLRLDDFWALTPAELMLLLGPDKVEQPMARSQLQALMKAHPDN